MMSSNPFNYSIKRRTLLGAGLALGALKFAGPAVSHGDRRSEEVWAGQRATARSRSATSCPTAGRYRPTR